MLFILIFKAEAISTILLLLDESCYLTVTKLLTLAVLWTLFGQPSILDKNSYSPIDVDENNYLHDVTFVYQASFQIRIQIMPAKFKQCKQITMHIGPKERGSNGHIHLKTQIKYNYTIFNL